MTALNTQAFTALMHRLAAAWSAQDAEAAVACFTPDAVYLEPPDVQYYTGHAQLHPYFAALSPGTRMVFHHLWFDEARQTGAGEFTFGVAGRPTADHGMVSVVVRDGRLALWREYPRKGPAVFDEFARPDGKSWQWHIGNYP